MDFPYRSIALVSPLKDNRSLIQEIRNILEALSPSLDINKIIQSIGRPWKENPEAWDSLLAYLLPGDKLQLSKMVNDKREYSTFTMTPDLRAKMLDRLLEQEDQIMAEVINKILADEGWLQSVANFLTGDVAGSWGDILPLGFKGLLRSINRGPAEWRQTQIRKDSVYRILWSILHEAEGNR